MTSEERREGRFQRRKAKREAKKRVYENQYVIEKIFTRSNLRKAFKKCRRCVSWKGAVQRYIIRSPIIITQTHEKLMNGTYKHSGFDEFDTFERGTLRHIKAIKFNDRVVQRCFCDNALVPVIGKSFIYDNGASQEGKGYHFSINRMICHLQRHYRKYGNEGYILLFDFSKFFDSVNHSVINDIVRDNFSDQRVISFFERFIASFGPVGLGLGSQISQIMALASANRMDHYCKEILRMKGYCRYMDDGYLISPSKAVLQSALIDLKWIAGELGFKLNEKKTKIVKLSHGFSWMKVRWSLTKTGKVVRKIYKQSVVKMRRKLKKFPLMIAQGKMDLEHANLAYQSWRGYAKHFHTYHNIRKMDALYKKMFPDVPVTRGITRKINQHANLIKIKLGRLDYFAKIGKLTPERYGYVRKAWAHDAKKFEQRYNTAGNQDWESAMKLLSRERRKVANVL